MGNEQLKIEQCPHCGAKLTLWQQVLLSVDRSLMCRNCWYRIVIDRTEEEPPHDVHRDLTSEDEQE